MSFTKCKSGVNFPISGRKKKIPMFSCKTMIRPLTQRLLQLSPLLPLHHFFVGKHFAGKIHFLLLPSPAHSEWPRCYNCSTHAAGLQMTCLATPSNWQLNTSGCDEPQQRWILQKKKSTKSRSGAFICSQILSFPLSLVQVTPLLSHLLVIQFLFPGLSPTLPSPVIAPSPRKCLYFPPVTSLWTKKMPVNHSLALFCTCLWGVSQKAGERKN